MGSSASWIAAFTCTVWASSLAAAQVTQRASVDSNGAQGNSSSTSSAISADGHFIAFASNASNLVAGDTNGQSDVFVRNRWTGVTERVSVDSNGVQGNGASLVPAISADGRYVAFVSSATNLVPGDTNGVADVFVRDRQAGTTERVNVDSSAAQANGPSLANLSISPDGRFVAFDSAASNLVAGDTNGVVDVFVRDRQTGTTERVSVDSAGVQSNNVSQIPSISSDGRYVAFQSSASNLVSNDTNGFFDVYVRDRQAGTTERISIAVNMAGQGDNDSQHPSISADGRFVAFDSFATNMVAGDTNGAWDCFVRDRASGTTQRVSVTSGSGQANGSSQFPWISADARLVAFESAATNLVAGDTNTAIDIFVRDRQLSATTRVSVDSFNGQANGDSFDSAISSDGRFTAFESIAANLVTGDTNGVTDVFVHDRNSTSFSSVCSPGVGGVIACPCSNPPFAPGSGCDNSSSTGGATLTVSGFTYLSMDTLVFTASGEKPTALSIFTQGSAASSTGFVFGQGVRCATTNLKRLYTKIASGGVATAPTGTDPSVHARSAALGDPIAAGTLRFYFVYYRDTVVLGGCPSSSTFNSTQTGRIDWSL